MNQIVKVAIGALELAVELDMDRPKIEPVRSVLMGNIQKLFLKWMSKKPKIGDKFIVEILSDDSKFITRVE